MKFFEAVVTFIVYMFFSLFLSLISAGIAYFALEVANSIDSRVPAFPFWAVYFAAIAIRALISDGSTASD